MRKLIVFGLAFLIIAGAAAAQNPVGTTAETVQLEGQPVKIVRDAYGVPRVFAASLESMFAGDGFAVAEDRAWQLEMYRLDAEGRLAEVFGNRFVERDKEVRRDGLTREELQQEFSQLPRRDQRILEAYAAGVNGYLTHAGSAHALPPEFTRYAVHPEPWSVEDSMALLYLQHWDNEARQDGVAQTIFEAWYQRLREDIFRPIVGDLGGSKNFSRFINPSSVYHALAGPQSSVKLSYDCFAGRDAEQVELQALREAVERLKRERGPEMSNWTFHFPWINFDPLPSIPWYRRGTYIQAVELAPAGVHGVWILPPGESENPRSAHYRDQLYLASWWMYTPMRFMSPP